MDGHLSSAYGYWIEGAFTREQAIFIFCNLWFFFESAHTIHCFRNNHGNVNLVHLTFFYRI